MANSGVWRISFAILAILLFAGCAKNTEISLVTQKADVGSPYEILVATTRKFDPEIQTFSYERAENVTYAKYVVSIPPSHEPGAIEWPKKYPDPAEHFVTREAGIYDGPNDFITRVNQRMANLPRREREVIVFVHGYNTNFTEGLYGLAQITHDFRNKGIPVMYSWPSAARVTGYVYDRDSAIIARNGLEELLIELFQSRAEKVLLVGHSMGGYLTMETLRQIATRGDVRLQDKLGGVILLSPDIDIDVFKSQVASIQPLPQPFIVVASSQDKALWFSSRLARDQIRLGSIQNQELLADINVTIVDSSNISDGDELHHSVFATSPAMVAILSNMNDADISVIANADNLQRLILGTAAIAEGAVDAVLEPGSQ